MQDNLSIAIIDVLNAHAKLSEWASGGIFIARSPQDGGRRDKYIVLDGGADEYLDPTQDGPATLGQREMSAICYASSVADAEAGCDRARWALDGKTGEANGVWIERIFCRGADWNIDEDAAGAERQIFGRLLLLDVKFRLPVEV